MLRIVQKNSQIIVTMTQGNTDIDIFEMTSIYFKFCEASYVEWPSHFNYVGQSYQITDNEIRKYLC